MSARMHRPAPPRLALDRREVAAAIGVSLNHFERHCQGEIPCVYVGKKRLYRPEDVDEWLRANLVTAERR